MSAAVQRFMSDARQSPIPQDRVRSNVDRGELAEQAKQEKRQLTRYLKEQGVDERPGTNPTEEPWISNEPPTSRAEADD